MRSTSLLIVLGPAIVLLGSPVAAQQAQGTACLFEHANFQGRRICYNAGQRVPALDPSMNDLFSSVQVQPGLRVTICEHANFAGRCVPVDRSIPNLAELGFNDKVSSIVVERIQAGLPGPGGPGRQQFDGPGRPRDFGGPPPMQRGPQYDDEPLRRPQMGGLPPRAYDDARSEMSELRAACDAGERRACIRFGIAIGRNWERRERWRQESPEFFSWER